MGVIINEADRMTRIVQDLLTLSKIDYGKMEMNISRFSFAKAISNVYEAASSTPSRTTTTKLASTAKTTSRRHGRPRAH